MPAYLIALVKVKEDGWIPDYAAKVHDIAARHGGKYLSRSANLTPLEGDLPDGTIESLIDDLRQKLDRVEGIEHVVRRMR